MLLHFDTLKKNMPSQMRAIAKFLDIKVKKSDWPRILEYCSFEWMKANATKTVPLGGAFWDGGAQVFINKGVNGRWQSTLAAVDNDAFEKRARAELGTDCARWLATGKRS
jgi:aryl sulfotransferase